MRSDKEVVSSFNKDTKVMDVINDLAFDDYGRLIFPVDMNIDDNLKLENISSILPWYSEINTDKTVEIVNYLKNEAQSRQIFYDIYSDEEKAADPDKKNTGIFFFKERNIRNKAIDLILVLIGMFFLYLGSK